MFRLDGSGNTGNWGIGSLSVVVSGPVAAAPTALRVVRAAQANCVLAWTNAENTVSNRIDAY